MDKKSSGEDNDSIDWDSDDEREVFEDTSFSPSSTPVVAPSTEPIASNHEVRSLAGLSNSKLLNHFVGMGFPEKLVLQAIKENGGGEINLILNTLLSYSVVEDSPKRDLGDSSDSSPAECDENFLNDLSDMDNWSEDEAEISNSLSERNKKLLSLGSMNSHSEKDKMLLSLANMGYPAEDAEIALERCGPEASIIELTDFLSAAQVAREQDMHPNEDGIKISPVVHQPKSNHSEGRKRKLHQKSKKKIIIKDSIIHLPKPMIGFGVPSQQPEIVPRSLPELATGLPFFYYENVALTPKGVWETISRFLYGIEPEFVDSKYFCAAARKRGYVHNLPIQNRFPLVPLPPLTISEAFPLTKKWWPAWDTRDKLNCLQTVCGSARLTERIRNALEEHDGNPPPSVQKYVIEQCRKWNLVWVGLNKVAPLEPDEIEMLLGFPRNHTRGGGVSRTDRYKSLGNSFQVDTVAYHFSVLKDMFPRGINLLSLFSGIGGAEVALHHLGIKLNNVVSVEKSKVNRDIVRSWWEQTKQHGKLIDIEDVRNIDGEWLAKIMYSIGGFDLVVGGSPCNNLAGGNRVSRDGLNGKESSLFYDYFRILDLVKCIMDG